MAVDWSARQRRKRLATTTDNLGVIADDVTFLAETIDFKSLGADAMHNRARVASSVLSCLSNYVPGQDVGEGLLKAHESTVADVGGKCCGQSVNHRWGECSLLHVEDTNTIAVMDPATGERSFMTTEPILHFETRHACQRGGCGAELEESFEVLPTQQARLDALIDAVDTWSKKGKK